MRPAFLIIGGNIVAAALGAVATLWLIALSGSMARTAPIAARPSPHPVIAAAPAKTACAAAAAKPSAASPIAGPAGAPPSAAMPQQAAPAGYVLQFGAYRSQADAARLAQALQAKSFPAATIPLPTRIGTLDLVEIGGFADRAAAQDEAASLQRATGLVPLVTRAAAS